MKNEIIHTLKQYSKAIQRGLFLCGGFLILSSCTTDDIPISGEPDVIEPLETGFVSLSVSAEKTHATKAFDGYEDGTSEERHVQAVRVVLYDGNDQTDQSMVKYAFDYEIESDQNSPYWKDNSAESKDLSPVRSMFTSSNFVTYAREVDVQPYRMLVIINPTRNTDPLLDLYTLTTEGVSKLADIENSITLDPAKLEEPGVNAAKKDAGIAAGGYFLMLNDQGLVDVPADWIQDSKNRAHQLPVPVFVDRAVAKVSLFPTRITDISLLKPGASISDFSWDLDVLNKKMYWMRVPAKSPDLTGTVVTEEVLRVQPPGQTIPTTVPTERQYRYAVDPNFDGFSGTTSAAIHKRKAEFFSYYYLENPYPSSFSKSLGGSVYCLENTMSPDDQFDEVITHVLIRCVYGPKNIAAGESFYLFDDEKVISLSEMKEYVMLINSDPLENWKFTPYRDLYSAIKNAMTLYPLNGEPTRSFVFKDSGHNLKYYYHGVNYYVVKIRHFDYGTSVPETAYGYYGIVRNTHYKVTITEIKGPGEPKINALEYNFRSTENTMRSNLYNLTATFEQNN